MHHDFNPQCSCYFPSSRCTEDSILKEVYYSFLKWGIHEWRSRNFLRDSVLFFNISKYLKNVVPFLQYYSLLRDNKICTSERKRAQRKENLLVSSLICLVKICFKMSECCTILYKNNLQPSKQLLHFLRDLFA
jgi:hypothetical protein